MSTPSLPVEESTLISNTTTNATTTPRHTSHHSSIVANGGTHRPEQQDNENPYCLCGYFFLTPEAVHALPNFQYKGEDRSLLYKYVLSPWASFCVEYLTPSWLAPNTLTLLGLIHMVTAYLILYYYSPTLKPIDYIPRWTFAFNAVAMWVYQTLDNMDGKQARKTGSSSPLGLLFDHGCDAINSVFGSANWILAMALDPSQDVIPCLILLFVPYTLFYVSTWEEYYTGELIMPIINGPSEGLLGGALLSLTSALHGPQFWQSRLPPIPIAALESIVPVGSFHWLQWLFPAQGWRYADLIVSISFLAMLQEISLKIRSTVRRYGFAVLYNLIPYACLVLCCPRLWVTQDPRICLHLSAVLFAEMTIDLMIQHVTRQGYQPLRWLLAPLVLLILGEYYHRSATTADWTIYWIIYTTAAATYVMGRIILWIHEICHALNIWCFDIITPRTRYLSQPGKVGYKYKVH